MVLVVKNPPANAGDSGDVGSIPEWGRSPGEGHGNPVQYSCLENPTDRGAWRVTVHGVTLGGCRRLKRGCWVRPCPCSPSLPRKRSLAVSDGLEAWPLSCSMSASTDEGAHCCPPESTVRDKPLSPKPQGQGKNCLPPG